ncbi:MAG: hypothetical protein BMS9Abin34_001 [Patescibacteria group bacterium]|nr:MAG: hypothetical protein BMS9Abin34_001 [Patescibacteria group bacterium]
MPTKPRNFDTELYYHVYNRGVEKRDIFATKRDYQRFLSTLVFYLHDQEIPYTVFQGSTPEVRAAYFQLNPRGSETQRVRVLAYCLMPNHFHLLLKPVRADGVTKYVSDISNSHTKYFNLKNKRVGRLFQNTFKSKEVSSEPSLMQLTRYIHLNPVLSTKTNLPTAAPAPQSYPYSSYAAWVGLRPANIVNNEELKTWLRWAGGSDKYKEFVEAKLAKSSALAIKELLLD